MVRNSLKHVSGRLLSSTERDAITKLTKLHQPILKEMEKWKEQREKLECTLLDQIDMVGKILKPYYQQSQKTLANITRRKPVGAKYPNKKRSSSKKSSAKKSGYR